MTWRIVDNSLLVGKYDPAATKGQGKQGLGVKRRKIAAFDFVSRLLLLICYALILLNNTVACYI